MFGLFFVLSSFHSKEILFILISFVPERKAREAEAQIRRIAQKAREQHRQQSLRTSTSILPILKEANSFSLREAV